jgi:carbon starvation protein
VTIACGAISGFHSLVASGTTPKMLNKEGDARVIGYGAMLCEAVVGVLALIAATSMHPGDYFAINTPVEVFAKLGMSTVNLDQLSQQIGEPLAGKTGGGVSLAVGMAQIFSGLPGMQQLIGYWFHFAIMFEALFILTTVDTGTRVARYVLQELLGKLHAPLGKHTSRPGSLIATTLVVCSWGYLIYTGNIATIWPMFGTGNQLLATIALAVVTTWLINMGKARYALLTAVPMVFVGVTTLTAGVLSIRDIFWPLTQQPGKQVQGYLDSGLMALFIIGVVLVVANAARRCLATLHGQPLPNDASGPPVPPDAPTITCC